MSVRSLILALKSLWFKKNPSTALSKTTTLSSWSVSSAVMISRNSRTNSGPIKLSGGLSNVTRQYLGDDRVSLICPIFAVSCSHGLLQHHNRDTVLLRCRRKAILLDLIAKQR